MQLIERVQKVGVGLALVGSMAMPIAVPALASAQRGADDTVATTVTEMETEHGATTTKTEAKDRKLVAAAKLDAAKLKVCEKREAKITSFMGRISDRGQKQLEVFTKISDRTKAFYVTKGKTLSNYNTLVADVDAKKAAAQTTLDTIKAAKADFKCDGTDPKGASTAFKDALKAEQTALKDYKTAVRNLIVGVKSVQSTTTDTTKTTESEN